MRIVEAQEAERSRLAQEVHDGPAQALTNAIFQVEYIERVARPGHPRWPGPSCGSCASCSAASSATSATFISQLRPPVLDAARPRGRDRGRRRPHAALTGLPIETDLAAPADRLDDAAQTVVLRIVQEALQNVRKHAAAQSSSSSPAGVTSDDWVLEIRDDGRGFDVGAVAARGRRNFGLQFMRERAELIGARFEVRSRPDGGTLVRLAIPTGTQRRGAR